MKTNTLILFVVSTLLGMHTSQAQTTVLHGSYKAVTIAIDQNVPYSRTLILLHEIYNGVDLLPNNYAIGTLTALRGSLTSLHRSDIVHINSGSAYSVIRGSLSSYNTSISWRLKTCIYNGKHYMALDVPYAAAQHTGYQFVGWLLSSGENLKTVTYEVNGVLQNQHLLSNIQDFQPNMRAEQQVSQFVVSGNVGIGITNPQAKLAVKGNIVAEEVKVKTDISVPDYVFESNYELLSLAEIETYVKEHKHLPEIPSAADIQREGLDLAEMNLLLLKKVEELTLHMITKEKSEQLIKDELQATKREVDELKGFIDQLRQTN